MCKRLRLLTLIVLLSHGLSWWITTLVPEGAAATISGVPGRIESLAALIASFAFTMLGFLAAVLALFGVMSGSSVLARYKKKGHLGTLLLVMGITMVELVLTFGAAIALYFRPLTDEYARSLAWIVTTNFVMLLVSTLPVVMLVKGTIESIKHD